jgi:hypothetical protein
MATPVPENGMDNVELVAVLVTATLPLKAPVAMGANVTLKLAVCPGAKVSGIARPLTLKELPVAVSVNTVTDEFPVFVSVTDCLLLLP